MRMRRFALYPVLTLAFVGVASCSRPPAPSQGPSLTQPGAAVSSATPTTAVDASGQTVPLVPNPAITPGDTLDVTVQDICTPGYSKKVRNVPEEVKQKAYAEYGIAHRERGEFEVDHLISLELGGSNSIRNLWPESYTSQPWNAHVKDALENELHREVCSGQLDLQAAQRDIAADWIAAYKRYFHTDAPLAGAARTHRSGGVEERRSGGESERAESPILPNSSTPPLAGQVWVNTRSGKYFHPGSRYYGHTKEGEYMAESQAEQRGFTAARGGE